MGISHTNPTAALRQRSRYRIPKVSDAAHEPLLPSGLGPALRADLAHVAGGVHP